MFKIFQFGGSKRFVCHFLVVHNFLCMVKRKEGSIDDMTGGKC